MSDRSRRLFCVLLLAVSVLPGCSASSVLNALQPGGGVTVARGIAYGEGERRRLDVYAPQGAAGAPVVVFFYGGGWDSGDRGMYAFLGEALAAAGFVTVIPDYRLYPAVRYPAFLEDSAAAVRWARDHADDHGGDPRRLALMGHSAGAYNAAMLAVDPRWLAGVGLEPRRDLRALVGLAGPYDFLPLKDETLKAVFAPSGDLSDTQPVNQVEAAPPPMFLGAARGDTTVLPRNTARLAETVRAAGGRVEERYYDGLTHPLMVGVFADVLSVLAPVREDVLAFLVASTAAEEDAAFRKP